MKTLTCQWIEGEPSKQDIWLHGTDAFKCGAPAVADKPYCEAHCKRAYNGRSRVVKDEIAEARRAAEKSLRERLREAQAA
jgi:hypothetical protein